MDVIDWRDKMISVMWFRKDLRLTDNKALYHALKDSQQIILLFQVNPAQFIPDSYNQHAFFTSVAHFKKQVDSQAHLHILMGDPLDSFRRLKKQVPSWDKIFWNEDETGYGFVRDQQMKAFFEEENIQTYCFQDAYLHGAKEVQKKNQEHYQIFTPYYKKWLTKEKELPISVHFDVDKVYSEKIFSKDELDFEKFIAAVPSIEKLEVGEVAARNRLEEFIKYDLCEYDQNRDRPDLDKTSRLSTHLRTGEISIRTVWEAVSSQERCAGRETYKKELCWREFYHMIATVFPNQKQEPIQKKYQYVQWENDLEKLDRWQNGQTGYPLVDAGMRQLKETGWMHNRLRMVTASFLTKDLLIDWRYGERYFQKMLVDYDAANNIGGWQWAASTGTDAVPYFRIFNPTKQSEKFDPSGAFIRKYVKELADVPKEFIHQPEKMSLQEQKMYRVVLGKDYPFPIVEHLVQRKRAIQLFEQSKEIALFDQ